MSDKVNKKYKFKGNKKEWNKSTLTKAKLKVKLGLD